MLIRTTLITLAASLAMVAMRRLVESAVRAREAARRGARDAHEDARPTLRRDPATGVYHIAD